MVHQGEPAVLNEESESPQGNNFENLMEKKRDPQLLPEPVEQQRQASVSPPPVADAGPGLTVRKQADRRESCTVTASPSDSSTGGAAIGGPQTGISVFGVSTVGRTHLGTLELIGHVGRKSWRFLIDSGSTGNYISAQVCAAHKVKVEEDPYPDQLTMADGTKTQTEGKVQLKFKCGGYRGTVQAKVFPGLQKPMILGIPWLQKENPHIDWTRGVVTVEQGQKWIELPLAQQKKVPSEELVTMISAKQMSRLLRKKPATRAFVGMIRKVTETVEEREGKTQSDLYSSQLQREDIPEQIKGILKEYSDVFPDELPVGLPPKRMGHEFKIDLEDDVPPVHRPLYKLSPLELTEAKEAD